MMQKVLFILVFISQFSLAEEIISMTEKELQRIKNSVFYQNVNFDIAKGKKYGLNGDFFMYESYFLSELNMYSDELNFKDAYRVLKIKAHKDGIYYQYEVTNWLEVYLTSNEFQLGSSKPIRVTKGTNLYNVVIISSMINKIQKVLHDGKNDLELIGDWSYLIKNRNLKLNLLDVIKEDKNIYVVNVNIIKELSIERTIALSVDLENHKITMGGILL